MKIGSTTFVAIVGGSGSGKNWLSSQIEAQFPGRVARVSLDDFYRDRSHLDPDRRDQINFDHPNAVDWTRFQEWITASRTGAEITVPRYDFETHSRVRPELHWKPTPLVLVDGLWLLWKPALRNLFELRIFIDCPEKIRLQRREARDIRERGRTLETIRRQFRERVAPMHEKYVEPQRRWADILLSDPINPPDLERVAARLRIMVPIATLDPLLVRPVQTTNRANAYE